MNIVPYTRIEYTPDYELKVWYDHEYFVWDGQMTIRPENITLGIQGNSLQLARVDAAEAFYWYQQRINQCGI